VLPLFSKETAMRRDMNEFNENDYANQQDGEWEGVPLIADQSVENSVRDWESVLSALGFSSIEEMIAAANAS
jgi:hypothetical protein